MACPNNLLLRNAVLSCLHDTINHSFVNCYLLVIFYFHHKFRTTERYPLFKWKDSKDTQRMSIFRYLPVSIRAQYAGGLLQP